MYGLVIKNISQRDIHIDYLEFTTREALDTWVRDNKRSLQGTYAARDKISFTTVEPIYTEEHNLKETYLARAGHPAPNKMYDFRADELV